MGSYDVTISVWDVDREEMIRVRNAVLQKIDPATDVSITITEYAEVNDAAVNAAGD